MSRKRAARKRAANPKKKSGFEEAVARTPHLEKSWEAGLQALRPEDRPHIDPENPRNLGGSVDVDSALAKIEPNANRWDFGIAYQHSDRTEEVIYWTELHTASDSEVKVVIRKAQWLFGWLGRNGNPLNAFERDVVWVSSGGTAFTRTSTQSKQLAAAGVRHVGSTLRIRNQRG